MYPLGQENTFWKKENVTLQPSAAKEPWYFHLVKQHISFWKENCVILFLCTDLCASHSKVQMTVWFITVMMMMKMIWEWRCLASSACDSWSYLFSGDMEMEKREETNVCWARCAALTDCHKTTRWVLMLPLQSWGNKKCRLREVNLTQIAQLRTRTMIWTQFYLTLNQIKSIHYNKNIWMTLTHVSAELTL